MNHEDVRRRFRAHLIAFISILALSLMSAGTVFIDTPNRSAVLAIAAVQVLIVLAAMMHAHREGPWVKWILAFCALNVAGLAGALYLGYFDTIKGTEHVVSIPAEQEPELAAEDADAEH